MKKVIVIGSSGSGKSTFSRKLSERLNIPVYHLDQLFWKPNWVMSTEYEKITIQNSILEKNEWIIDGNYSGILEDRLQLADTVIFLNLPRRICYYRVFKRFFKNIGKTRIDMGEDCKEKISFTLLKFIWNYPKQRKPFLLNKLDKIKENKNIIILSSTKEINNFKYL
ncbi:DNA topology modulation protein [Staphylococcus xylosus]